MDYTNAFFTRKSGKGSSYNFDISPLIDNFTFYEFINNIEKHKLELKDYGGFVVITNKQYIIGYNAGFGVGTHLSSFARTYKDIKGGGNIQSDAEASKYCSKCDKDFLTARITYEYFGYDEYRRPIYSGYITFDATKKITEQQYESFKLFYEQYNSDIEYITKKLGVDKFSVNFTYRDENNILLHDYSNNLDKLLEYLSKNIDYEKTIDDDNEIIIGTSTNKKNIL